MALQKISVEKAPSTVKQLKKDFMKKHKDGNHIRDWGIMQ